MPWQACDHTQSKTRRKRNSERERERKTSAKENKHAFQKG